MFQFEAPSPADDPVLHDLWQQAFHLPADYWPVFTRRIGPENLRVHRSGREIVGALGIYRMGQWFGGRSVPCAGVAAVAVAPEQRGRGVAKSMLGSLLQELHASEVPLAALHPSTQQVYRSVGFEQAGSRYLYEMQLNQIGVRSQAPLIRRLAEPLPEHFEELHRQRAQLENGHLDRTAGLWERLLNSFGDPHYAYVVDDEGQPQGYLIAHRPGGEPKQIVVRDWCALTPAAAQRLWTLLADHASTIERVRWFGPPSEPMLAHPAECRPSVINHYRWMLRLVDVERALVQRGYPPVSGEVHLSVEDPLIPHNTGRFVLALRNGEPIVERGGRGDLCCSIRGLSPLYAGFFSPGVLARLGWLTGSASALETATRIFAGPEPWMPEHF